MITMNGSTYKYEINSIRASQTADSTRYNNVKEKHSHKTRHCNICRQVFTPENKYQLFCGKCRTEDDSFIFNEWLPRLPEQLSLAAGV